MEPKLLEKYNKILKSSYKNQSEAKQNLEGLGYKYDDNLSSNDAKVFVDENGQPNIAFRGTHNFKN